MKLTDFALIFVAIILPVVIIVFVNTAFVVKAEKQEMYYKNMMNSAITDAVFAMKQVENENSNIDYGYSGIVDKKVSVNSSIAVSTFYNSLAGNFNIKNNEYSIERLKMYIPVLAIMDYDGIYIHSAEEDENKNVIFNTKPKVHYTYSYVILKNNNLVNNKYEMVSLQDIEDINGIKSRLLSPYVYEINFTMDDYVYLTIYNMDETTSSKVLKSKGFYLADNNNNEDLIYEKVPMIVSTDKIELRGQIISNLKEMRKSVIAKIAMKEISYAVNKHNEYARQAGIKYNFNFSVESDTQWYETIDGIGAIAIIQGISLGNRYLNYKAYSASDLIISKKYYVSEGISIFNKEGQKIDNSYMNRNLYHISDECEVYKNYLNSTDKKLIPNFYSSKKDAATQGFYPCPVCNP